MQKGVTYMPFAISRNAPYLFPKILYKHFFLISLGTAVITRRNEKQRLCKILSPISSPPPPNSSQPK